LPPGAAIPPRSFSVVLVHPPVQRRRRIGEHDIVGDIVVRDLVGIDVREVRSMSGSAERNEGDIDHIVADTTRGPVPLALEARLLRADGGEFWALVRAAPLPDKKTIAPKKKSAPPKPVTRADIMTASGSGATPTEQAAFEARVQEVLAAEEAERGVDGVPAEPTEDRQTETPVCLAPETEVTPEVDGEIEVTI